MPNALPRAIGAAPPEHHPDCRDAERDGIDHAGFETQVVYEASIYLDNLTFRWISPLWKDKLLAESLNRGVDSKKAYDDVSFNDISAECFLLVSNDIVNNAANQ